MVSSGLGGGSLIYANVLLRKDEKWFVHEDRPATEYEYWPVTRADLDPHYDRVETDARRRSATRSSQARLRRDAKTARASRTPPSGSAGTGSCRRWR